MGIILASDINHDLIEPYRVKGYYIYDENDKDVAQVQDLLIDEETHEPRYAVLEVGGFLSIKGRKVLIPWAALRRGGISRLDINCPAEQIFASSPLLDPLAPTRPEEESLHRYYSAEPYWLSESTLSANAEPKEKPAENETENIENLSMEKDE